ncbi:MAG TPA: polyprenyl synthetase family protein [Methanomicrobiales archaeon]|jgi:geranylgeranyl diphosphate synthase type I|nr:polyprenyl synthetase family protein [Methanomicrobiales archaeon]
MELSEYLSEVARDVDQAIHHNFGNPYGELAKASAHLLTAGGKRLRPAMLFLSADSVKKGSAFDLMPAALAVELIHSFTLIHDDIMDQDAERRGVPTVHTLWDEPTAILAGDVLYARAFEFLCRATATDSARVRAVSLLAHTCAEICDGQHQDMAFEQMEEVSEVEYLEMVRKKTGSLYAASASIGAILAGAKPMQADALYQFGLTTGIAFQIQDDLIDLTVSSSVSGKDRGSDLREGKKTLIAIRARERGMDLPRGNLTEEQVDKIVKDLEDAGVIADVRETAERILASGKACLGVVPESEEKQLLISLGDHFLARGS